jgi:hypothetical protein
MERLLCEQAPDCGEMILNYFQVTATESMSIARDFFFQGDHTLSRKKLKAVNGLLVNLPLQQPNKKSTYHISHLHVCIW